MHLGILLPGSAQLQAGGGATALAADAAAQAAAAGVLSTGVTLSPDGQSTAAAG